MTPSRLFALCLAVVVVGACNNDDELGPAAPTAGLRFVHAVGDTGAMDLRVVDIVGDAPQFLDNTFRAFTAYQSVTAGTRRIKAFMKPVLTDTLAGGPLMWDTTFTFVAGTNYTVLMTGFARTGSTPPLQMLITTDAAPTPAAGQIALRVVHAGSGVGAIDAFTRRGVEAPPGAPLQTNLAFGNAGAYGAFAAARLSVSVTPTGTTGPMVLQAGGPLGEAGTPALNPIGGALVPGSVLTAVIVPASVVPSAAPQGGRPASRTVPVMTRSNDTVTVRGFGTTSVLTNRSPVRPDSVVGTTGTTTGVVASDVVQVSGAAETEYNDWQVILAVDSLSSCNPTDPGDTPTRCNATNMIATTHHQFKHRILGTPATPATGTPVYRIYPRGFTSDYTIPYVLHLVDRRPAMTVP